MLASKKQILLYTVAEKQVPAASYGESAGFFGIFWPASRQLFSDRHFVKAIGLKLIKLPWNLFGTLQGR